MKSGKTPMDRLRALQRDPEHRAAVAELKREAEMTFWSYFSVSMFLFSVLAYLWGEPLWNLIQTLGDFEAPASIGFLFVTLFLAVAVRKIVGINFFTD